METTQIYENNRQYLGLVHDYVKELHSMTGEPLPNWMDIDSAYISFVFDKHIVVKFIKQDGNTIGFIIFEDVREIDNLPFDWFIMETYITPEYRGKGLIANTLRFFKGDHNVKAFGYVVLNENHYADDYWQRRFKELGFVVNQEDIWFPQFEGCKGYVAKRVSVRKYDSDSAKES